MIDPSDKGALLSELHAMATRNEAQAADLAALRQGIDDAQRSSRLALEDMRILSDEVAALLGKVGQS